MIFKHYSCKNEIVALEKSYYEVILLTFHRTDFLNVIQVGNAWSSVSYLACFQYDSQEVLKCICIIAILKSTTSNFACLVGLVSPSPQDNVW